tara:strand:+ start:251 stop:430 length:180 start_codon:yes stop_codon:yes gene_type:complete
MSKHFKRAAFAVFLIACLYLAGDGDYEEAQRQAAQYQTDFCAGYIPDYDNRGPDCSAAN